TDDRAVAIDDRADGIDDGEDGDPRRADLTERTTLAARLGQLEAERLADRRRAPCASLSERERALARCAERGAAELLVGIHGVLARAEVEDDRADHVGDRRPADIEVALFEKLRRHARAGLEAVERAAGEADR